VPSQSASHYEEAIEILSVIKEVLPRHVDGKQAIIEMRDQGSPNWRQMEWIGFWFEHFVKTKIIPLTGGHTGPTYGKTTFDYQRKHVWDLKSHPSDSGDLILNDREAIDLCIKENSGLGFFIIEGNAEYDKDQEFKSWHDLLKGGTSKYEKERIARKAPSRVRKTSFSPQIINAIWFPNQKTINDGLTKKWLTTFQEGMRNSNGKLRRGKYKIDPNDLPEMIKLFSQTIK